MVTKTKKYDIGVIIGRFQTNRLHDAHKEMISEVLKRHDKVILLLGVSPTLGTRRNGLDFRSRKVMMEETFDKEMIILPLYDKNNDEIWSKQVDRTIREVEPIGSVVLYGSRDSFIPHYKGKFDTIELVPTSLVSATQIREEVSRKVIRDEKFRSGVIYGVYNNYPITHPVIDVAIMNEDDTQVLLGRKKEEEKFRFVGGFVDVTDKSYEQTAIREAYEETGLEVGDLKYVCSRQVDDWRYRNDDDRSVMTTFFKAKKIFGAEKANDDIVEIRWFDIHNLHENQLVKEHAILLNELINYLNK